MQVTRAMFEGTDGWMLKPRVLLGEHAREKKELVEEREQDEGVRRIMIGPQRFSCEILGVSSGTFPSTYHSSLCFVLTSSLSSSTPLPRAQ